MPFEGRFDKPFLRFSKQQSEPGDVAPERLRRRRATIAVQRRATTVATSTGWLTTRSSAQHGREKGGSLTGGPRAPCADISALEPAAKMGPPRCGSPYRVTGRVSRNSSKVPGGASTDLPWPISPVAAPIAAPAAGPPRAKPTSDPAAALPAVFRPLRGPDCS